MKFLSTHRDAPSWMSLIAAVVLCADISGELNSSQLAMATERPIQVSQAPAYMRRRQGPMVDRRGYWPSRYGNMGFQGYGVGPLRYTPWYPGGFYSPPVQGSWYQRPYPYHFDIYRGQLNYIEETVPDAVQ